MSKTITRAAVIGSGVMGAAIAAHLANAGVSCLLLDLVPADLNSVERARGLSLAHPSVRSRLAISAIAKLANTKPAPLYENSFASRITPGNLEDDLVRIREVDWVIEAVVERLEVKRDLLARIEAVWSPGTLVSSNTSGLSIEAMVEGRGDKFRAHFLGTHFFNPPRYMKLLEIIPGPDTLPEQVERIRLFSERKLGKGVVLAKDTPNFIANRIGTFGLLITLRLMQEEGYRVEEVDAVTGPALGRPKSATFRTLDVVGLDTLVHVADNVYSRTEDEDEKAWFAPSPLLLDLTSRGWNGEKSGQGFYKKVKGAEGSEIQVLDWKTMTYVTQIKPSSPALDAVKSAKGIEAKLTTLLGGEDRYALLAWETLSRTLIYAAEKADEIAETLPDIDRAMRWGFQWELGPFELWDAIGLIPSVKRMESEGKSVPVWVKEWIETGHDRFYKRVEGKTAYVYRGDYLALEQPADSLSLRDVKERGGKVLGNSGASLLDIGDGVACLEFHSRSNAIGEDILTMIRKSVDEVRANYDALIIANEGRNFCVGANLLLLLTEAQDEEWDEVDRIIRLFQDSMLKLKRLEKPVVAAPHRMTLGGGVEVCMAADEVCIYAETYYGLVEAGVGLIPAGGGCKETVLRISQAARQPDTDLQPELNEAFRRIGTAQVSTSAHEAKRLGCLRESDRIVINQDYLIQEAKRSALRLAQAGYEPQTDARIRVAGRDGAAVLKLGAYGMRESGYISGHDLRIASKLAHVLAGGDVPAGSLVTEQYLLDLEREAFLSLCGEPKTQQRMQHMLRTGKPLRN